MGGLFLASEFYENQEHDDKHQCHVLHKTTPSKGARLAARNDTLAQSIARKTHIDNAPPVGISLRAARLSIFFFLLIGRGQTYWLPLRVHELERLSICHKYQLTGFFMFQGNLVFFG